MLRVRRRRRGDRGAPSAAASEGLAPGMRGEGRRPIPAAAGDEGKGCIPKAAMAPGSSCCLAAWATQVQGVRVQVPGCQSSAPRRWVTHGAAVALCSPQARGNGRGHSHFSYGGNFGAVLWNVCRAAKEHYDSG